MKRNALAFCLLALTFPGMGATSHVSGLVTGDNVNLRVEPSLRAEIVGQLHRGDRVEVILQDGEWCAIIPPKGITGWIASEFIGPDGAVPAAVNIRSGPSVSHARLARLDPGQRPEIIRREEGWLEITLPLDACLWISSRFVDLLRDVSEFRPSPILEQSGTQPPIPSKPDHVLTPTPAHQPFEARPSPSPVRISRQSLPLPSPPALTVLLSPLPTEPLPLLQPSPSPSAGETMVLTGIALRIPQPYQETGRLVTHFLVRDEQRAVIVARLAASETDLDRYHRRRVRLWGVEVGHDVASIPLLEVRGVQAAW